MRFAQLIALVALLFGTGAFAADEAAIFEQLRSLQQTPDPALRGWLEELSAYRSQQMVDLQESRNPLLVPRYPIAAAAQAALEQLEIAEKLHELRQAEPALPANWQDRVTRKAWVAWLAESPTLPSALSAPGVAANVPESLLRAISSHPQASAAWTQALLRRAQEGASLRWMDSRLPTLAAESLHHGEKNPALAESVWTEWARRANQKDQHASHHLQHTALKNPAAPGLAAGLALWGDARKVLANLTKSTRASDDHQRLAQRVQLRRNIMATAQREQP